VTYQPDPAVKNAQSRARRHGLRLSTRANTFTLRDSNGHTVACGEDLASVAAHIPGHTMAETPPEWEQLIGEHLRMLTAAGPPARQHQTAPRPTHQHGPLPASPTTDLVINPART
jgi:hypothetical protein